MHMSAAQAQGLRPPGQVPAQQHPAEAQQTTVLEVELTQSHIDAFIAADKEIAVITAKLKGNRQPTDRMMMEMDAVARKYGFDDFVEFSSVDATIASVFGRISPESRKYDPEAMIKRQIGLVHGDSKMPPEQKLRALKDLHRALTSGAKLRYPANAELVARNYDRLRPQMGGSRFDPPQPQQAPPQQQRQPARR